MNSHAEERRDKAEIGPVYGSVEVGIAKQRVDDLDFAAGEVGGIEGVVCVGITHAIVKAVRGCAGERRNDPRAIPAAVVVAGFDRRGDGTDWIAAAAVVDEDFVIVMSMVPPPEMVGAGML